MNNPLHCRFCAELKGPEKIVTLDENNSHHNDIIYKLSMLNISLSKPENPHITLPVTICLICLHDLHKACEFIDKYKRSQIILTEIYNRIAFFGKTSDINPSQHNEGSTGDAAATVKPEPPDKSRAVCGNKQKDTTEYFPAASPLSDRDHSCPASPQKCDVDFIKFPEASTSYIKNSHSTEKSKSNLAKEDQFDLSLKQESMKKHLTCEASKVEQVDHKTNTETIPVIPFVDANLFAEEVNNMKKSKKRWIHYKWLCVYCNIQCPDISVLREHAKSQHGRCAAFTCSYCGTDQYDSFNDFISHVRKHKKSLRKQCVYCDLKCSDISVHTSLHVAPPQAACGACGELLPTEEALLQHSEAYTTLTVTLPPKEEQKTTKRRRRGTPVTKQELTCDVCHKVYKSLNSLKDHKANIHQTDRKKEHTCDKCGKAFYNKGALTTHISMHEQSRPHVCKICNRSFLFAHKLRYHVLTHSGVKPFSCEECGKCFRLKNQLNTHKAVHSNLKPFVCQYCSKVFKFKGPLQAHERIHTGARPYSCSYCAMDFTNWSNYNKHMKRRHGTDTAKKKITPEGVFPVNPVTGKIIEVDPTTCEQWTKEIMIPHKRGKKIKSNTQHINNPS